MVTHLDDLHEMLALTPRTEGPSGGNKVLHFSALSCSCPSHSNAHAFCSVLTLDPLTFEAELVTRQVRGPEQRAPSWWDASNAS